MKIALISITEAGRTLAKQVSKVLEDDPTVIRSDLFHKNVNDTLKNVFHSYDCIIGIMATGIMIRNICPLIRSKENDPAVLVIDEKGKHVISLISGHLGGANDLSIKIADIVGGKPIITTSTDINNKLGIDSLAKKYYLKFEDTKQIQLINSALINGEEVNIALNEKFNFIWDDVDVKNSYFKSSEKSTGVRISNSLISIDLIPMKIVVGIGSRKNIESETVINAVKSTLEILGLPVERINSLATGQMKEKESGIINAALELGLPLEIIPEKTLKTFKNSDLTHSDFVFEKFGVLGVCEPSSLIAAGNDSTLIFRKTAFKGVTVAVAVSKN